MRHQTCRRALGSREQAALISGDAWQQETLLTLQQVIHVGNPAADPTPGHGLEVVAGAQNLTAQLLLHKTLVN